MKYSSNFVSVPFDQTIYKIIFGKAFEFPCVLNTFLKIVFFFIYTTVQRGNNALYFNHIHNYKRRN